MYFYVSLVLLALSALSKEIDDLVVQANTTFYNPLLFYGEGFGNDTIDDGEAAKAISRILPTLQHVNMNQLLLSSTRLVWKNLYFLPNVRSYWYR